MVYTLFAWAVCLGSESSKPRVMHDLGVEMERLEGHPTWQGDEPGPLFEHLGTI